MIGLVTLLALLVVGVIGSDYLKKTIEEEAGHTIPELTTTSIPEYETKGLVPSIKTVIDAGADPMAQIKDGQVIGEDATEAFQFAVDNYDTFTIPEGQYRIDGTIEVNRQVTVIGEGGLLLTNGIEGEKTGIFRLNEEAAGSIFDGLEVRAMETSTPFMPGDTPTAITSNRIFIDGNRAVDVEIRNTITHGLMSAVNGVGMDNILVSQSKFLTSYIGIWLGDTKGITIEKCDFSTSETADVYAHSIYIGFDTEAITIRDISISQTSPAGGALLNFAWVSGDPEAYYIKDVLVDGVDIGTSQTVNYVVQCIGVENAVFRGITGTLVSNPNDKARQSLYRGQHANGSIVFEDCTIDFQKLNTLLSPSVEETATNLQVAFKNCDFTIQELQSHFIRAFVQEVSFEGCRIDFGDRAITKNSALYQTGVTLTFKDTSFKWSSDFMRLCSSIERVEDRPMVVVFDACRFEGQVANEDFFVLNGIEDHDFTFTNNQATNFIRQGFDTSSIRGMVHEKYLEAFEYEFANNDFKWQ